MAALDHYVDSGTPEAALPHVAPAVHGFFQSVALGQSASDRTDDLQVTNLSAMAPLCSGTNAPYGDAVRRMHNFAKHT